jgi:hypothetical protein
MSDDFDVGGNDVLDEDQINAMTLQTEQLLRRLEHDAATSTEVKTWLGSRFGKAVRTLIAENKFVAMQQAVEVEASPDEVLLARNTYDVWHSVESVFAQLICIGDEALNELQLRADNADD